MAYEIDAIYSNGAFVPVAPIGIAEGVRVHLRIDEKSEDVASMATDPPKQSRAAMQEFLRKMAELPIEGPDDGFSAEDHDKLIYTLP